MYSPREYTWLNHAVSGVKKIKKLDLLPYEKDKFERCAKKYNTMAQGSSIQTNLLLAMLTGTG